MNFSLKSLLAVLAAISGWTVAHGAAIIPLLPPSAQVPAGTAVAAVGLLATAFTQPMVSAAPTPSTTGNK